MPKKSSSELAILGGKPAFSSLIHVGRPNLGNLDSFFARITDMFARRWFTNNGPYVEELEQKLAEYLGVRHCLVICNATVALELVVRALDMTGEVLVPSFTFVATAHALQWQGITPVFCDVGDNSHHVDPGHLEEMITPRTTGILGVHVWGKGCDVDAIADVAERHQLKVVYDAAHAFGCSYDGQLIGQFGDAEVFSFHATKFFNTFEGGAVTTNNDELAKKLRYMRNFGFAGYDNVEYIGINGKMTEVAAAMGLAVFDELDSIIETNKRNYLRYKTNLDNIPGITLTYFDENERNNFQYIIIEVDELITGISRDNIVKILHAENVLVRRYFYPGCHQMEPYRSYFPHAGLLLPNTERLTQRVICLPTGTMVSESDIDIICQLLRFLSVYGMDIQLEV